MGLGSSEYRAQIDRVIIRESFAGFYQWKGHDCIRLNGWFGNDFLPLLTWKKGIPLKQNSVQEFWPVYQQDETVEVRYCLSFYSRAEHRIIRKEKIENPTAAILLEADHADEVSVSMEARGEGILSVGEMIVRVIEDEKIVWYRADSNREIMRGELKVNDKKNPLIVIFSDLTLPLGQEWQKYIVSTGVSILLIEDNRLRDGLFFLGSQELESSVLDMIQKAMDRLALSKDHLVLTGISAGATAAIYYGTQMKPRYMIIGNPVINLGTVAERERLARTGETPIALDLLLKQGNGVDENSASELNQRLTDRIRQADMSKVRIDAAYMTKDNWDPEGWADLLQLLLAAHATVYGKGFEGRHREKCEQIMEWLKIRFGNMMETYFQKES